MTTTSGRSTDQRALILAPHGRDGPILARVLATHGLASATCATLADLVGEIRAGAGLAFATEEALAGAELAGLVDWIAAQPAWSDFPLVVLATKQPIRRSDEALARLESLGNVVLLERPLNAQTLVSAARAALRARTRQYQSRRHLEEHESLLVAERAAREAAEFAGRVKDEFLATLSHELRTPLSAILGWVHVLRRRANGATEITQGIDIIEKNARAQARLIEELLDMSRIVAGSLKLEWQAVAPDALLEAVVSSLQPSIDAKAIRLSRHIETPVATISGDANRLQQVVWNLLSNAVKFTPPGGHVDVRFLAEPDAAIIEVADRGEGISPEFLPFVFDRFRQADGTTTRRHAGLGLGLAIVRQLVELHGGSVQAHSDGLGQGATFRVRLPRRADVEAGCGVAGALAGVAAEVAGGAACGVAGDGVALDGVDVVLVDDDADGRDTVARLLEVAGARVVQAASADDALVAVGLRPPQVLISDIGMPGVDGYELLRRARERGFAMPAIALTAFARPEERDRALQAGYRVHLAKPVEPAALVATIAQLLEERDGIATAIPRPSVAD